ncbi:hypothetical protein Bca4012_066607 [Brassica carinata]
MAISQAQPLLLPLFVSLLFLPAALGIRFETCKSGHHYPVDVKTVEIAPYPIKRSTNGNFTITGYTSKKITNGATVELRFTIPTMIPVTKKIYSLCDIVACPVAPGPIVFTLSNIFTEQELLYRGYQVSISITAEHQKEALMCVWFTCMFRGHTSLLREATE